jgi:hypothetical protein
VGKLRRDSYFSVLGHPSYIVTTKEKENKGIEITEKK